MATAEPHAGRSLAPTYAAAGVAVACAAALALVAAVDQIHFAFEGRNAKVMLQTAVVLVSALAGFLVVGRFRRVRRLRSLLLALALFLTALSTGLFGLWSATLKTTNPVAFWGTLFSAALIAVLFAVAAWVPADVQVAAGRTSPVAAVALPAAIGAIALASWLLEGVLPQLGRPAPVLTGVILGPSLVVALQLAGAAGYFAAAAGLLRRGSGDRFIEWIAIGCVLAGFARLSYLLFSPAPFWALHTGDLFRLFAVIAFVVGGTVEILSYWQRLAQAAVVEERRRIARDLHDRVAQEIAYIERNASLLDDSAAARRIVAASERALAESRRAIRALGTGADEPLDLALGAETQLAASRYDAALQLDLESGIDLDRDRREALIRIASEAVSNAARHGRAPHVRVELHRSAAGVRLRVVDDGAGFDTAVNGHDGYGLVSMRERAQALGGEVTVRSEPGRGTQVEVVL
jgi:signal transduction histidine kinase